MIDFVHLHTHSEYSILDSTCKIEELLRKAKELGMPALALTDHGTLSGAIEFYIKAQAYGIVPIIGAELYMAPGSRFDRSGKKYHHLLVLAADNQGYRNLIKLTSLGYTEGFYYKPRVDKELLRKYGEGLIATSGCKSSEIPRLIAAGKKEQALACAQEFLEIFNGRFYIEIQNHLLPEEQLLQEGLTDLAALLRIPLVATNDIHYLNREDREAHEVLLNIQGNKTIYDEDRRIYEGEEYYFKSAEEMAQAIRDEEALENTLRIAQQCNVKLDLEEAHLPSYDLPPPYTDAEDYLEKLVLEGAQGRYGKINPEIKERLQYELSVIKNMGYAAYFLIVHDFVKFAKEQGIPVGPGRGSAAGSLVSYCLGITDIDPISYGLLFERFLNPARISLPDIDIDFCERRRDEVIKYVEKKYGKDRVAQIGTFVTMAARSAVRDVARVLKIPYAQADKIAKMIPFGYSLKQALTEVSALRQLYEEDQKVRKLIDISRKLSGLARNPSTHAAGVVIAPGEITEYAPLVRLPDGQYVTQYDMNAIESIGLLKIDFLALRNLTVIDDTLAAIERATGKKLLLSEIPLNDSDTFKLLQEIRTVGVFQLESPGIRELLKRLRPTDFKDIIAILALYRPGPLESGMANDYVERKHGRQKITYPHPELEEVLAETYGLPIYQEQLLLMARKLAGFSLSEADILRMAVGKKKKAIMEELSLKFVEGCLAHGISKKKALELFSDIEKFARYGFNKSHSAAYALISYWTAYLKANFPAYYMAALLTSAAESISLEKVAEYIQECREMGIDVLPPDINESFENFTVVGDKIRFGLSAIKNVGRNSVLAILEARRSGPFASFFDFCKRVHPEKVNREVLESLIKAGAFDRFGKRKSLLEQVKVGLELGQRARQERKSGQRSFFSLEEPQIRDEEEFSQEELLRFEKELLGLFVSGHPLLQHEEQLSFYRSCSLKEVELAEEGKELALGGRIDKVRTINTSNGKRMAFFVLEDLTGQVEVTVFPPQYSTYGSLLKKDNLILVAGKLERRNDKSQVVAEQILPLEGLEQIMELHLLLENGEVVESLLSELKQIFKANKGDTPAYIHIKDGEKVEIIKVKEGVKLSKALSERIAEILGAEKIKLVRR